MLYNFYDYELGMMTEESLTKSVNLMGFATLEEAGLEYDQEWGWFSSYVELLAEFIFG